MKSQKTRSKLLGTGIRTLSRDGLSGVTLGRLADACGMSKSGLVAQFHSKQSLEIALLDEAAGVARAYVVEPAMTEPEGLPRLLTLVRLWFGWPARVGLPGGCPVAAALFELDDATGQVRDHVAELERNWRALLMALVTRAIELKHLKAGVDVEQFVWELCGLYLTHHVSIRFLRDPAADRRAQVAVDALLARAGAHAHA